MIAPSPKYDPTNEAQFRQQIEQDGTRSVRTDRAAPFILMTDQITQETYRITIESGVIVHTVVA